MLTIKSEYNDFVTKTFRIPREFNGMLEELAKNHNTSVNKVVIQCLEFSLKNIDESEFTSKKS
ncbi:MAG: Arc family DNA-binding protein [Butyrivibrio sp.]|nr:Arc family DNA-binding protein [Butyrivibrio sp.]